MNCLLPISAITCLSLVACETMNAPISSGSFDPLRPPGSNAPSTVTTGPTFSAGQFVKASMDNTAFFKVRPTGDADADKLLKQNTQMKVISNSSSYVKVELDSGEIGFIPAIMLEDPNAVAVMETARPGEFQVYPPLPGSGLVEPLPVFDPSGLPPEGAIPTIIDPEAPAVISPVPSPTIPSDNFAAPVPDVELKVEASVPLPPNTEDLKAKAAEKKPEEKKNP